MDVVIKVTPTEVHSWLSVRLVSRRLRLNGLTAARLRQLVLLSIVICSVRVRFGFVSSRINQLHVNLLTSEWVKVREIQQDGSHRLLQVVCFSKLKVFLLTSQRRLFDSQLRSCQLRQSLL